MTVKVKDESAAVAKRMRSATLTSLSAASAYIRGIARRSISTKKHKKPSAPGKPPHSPTRRLRDAIVFSVEKAEGRSVIGPTLSVVGRIGRTHEFSGVERKVKRPRGHQKFNLEVGGYGPLRATRKKVQGVGLLLNDAQLRRARDIVERLHLPPWEVGEDTTTPRKYPARPFMGPALARSKDRLPAFWKNSLKRF